MKPAINVKGLGKLYQLGLTHARSLNEAAARWTRRLRGLPPIEYSVDGTKPTATDGEFWALRDVDFEVQPGKVVGIIGRNGAGKSTLLKILSRVTKPTAGRVEMRGRVGSLLEVGTGFHPELTGRENVYMNGTLLGMTKAEVRRRFDEIVDFAGVGRFVDTPVKRYSSGMKVRLGFAVAAHLEPEILIIDEVLAVGDAEFQRKCLTRMQEVGRGGRTILFVSHNMSAVRAICTSCILIERGRVIDEGPTDAVIDGYLAPTEDSGHRQVQETASFLVKAVEIRPISGSVIKPFEPVTILVRVEAKTEVRDPGLYLGFLTAENQRLAGLDYKDFTSIPPISAGQEATLGFSIQSFPLLPGSYLLEIHLKDMSSMTIERLADPIEFIVVETPVYGGRKLDHWFGHVGLNAKALYSEATS